MHTPTPATAISRRPTAVGAKVGCGERPMETTMDSEVSARVRIEMSHARAWKLLRNLDLAGRYVPGVSGCTLTSSQREGVGASRRIEQPNRAPMQETVVEWVDGEGFTLQLHAPGSEQAPMPFSQARFRYRIARAGTRAVDAELSMSYSLRGGALGQVADALVMRSVMRKQVESVAAAMKAFYEEAKG